MAKKHDTTKREAIAREALHRAESGQTLSNFPAIYDGMLAKGILESDILPRQNIFTYRAWQAKGRQVKRGEKGVRVVTWIDITRTDEKSGEETHGRIPRNAHVFHISQTKELETQGARA